MVPPTPPPRKPIPLSPTRVWSAERRHPCLRYTRATLEKCLAVLDVQPGPHPPPGELSLAFLTDDALARLHGDFLDDPSPTDVITFPGDDSGEFAGEICVSVDRAELEAKKRRHPFAFELTLYLVHGWLHLAGLDDLTPRGRKEMRRGERRMLAALRRAQALPDFQLSRAKK
ncbi:MAG TPA: rRNA maturation RNase YbeY [Opitutales bacterium]|nr:rRNA maturation RNase YbeY [Opitutales bacterium]